MVVFEPKRKRDRVYRYYHCTDGKRIHDRQVNVREEAILEQLGGAVDAVQITEELATAISDVLNETHRQAQKAKEREIDRYRAQLDELEGKEDRLHDMFVDGRIDDEGFRRRRDRIRQQGRTYTDHLQAAQQEIDGAYLVTAQRVLELAKNAKRLWESRTPEDRRDLLKKLLSNPVLDGRSVRYDLRKPFRILAEMRESEQWRGGRDSLASAERYSVL
jgi:hypothetical protein